MCDLARRLPHNVIILEHTAPARLGRRTKDLVKRLRPDEIAIIDHADLDRVSAEELAEAGVRVVVNVAHSASGRFPNTGPLELVPPFCVVEAVDHRPRRIAGDLLHPEMSVCHARDLRQMRDRHHLHA